MPRLDPRVEEAPGISAPLAGMGTAVAIGVAEWLLISSGAELSPEALQAAIVLVAGGYAALGLAAGLAAWAAGRVWAAPAVVLSALVAISAAGGEARALALLAALALGAIVLRIAAWVFARWPELPRARTASSLALTLIAVACALAARDVPAFGPRWAAGALVAALAGALLVWIPRVRGSALLAAAGALALCWQGAQHVPRLAPTAKPAALAPSVLLVTIDTLRADRVGAYGYPAARTPNLDALAAEGVLFRNAFAHSMFTGPSHATILSSRLPTSTGVFVNHQTLDDRFETLAEAFARAGFVTAAFPSSYATAERTTHLPGRFQFVDEDTHEHATFPQAVRRCVLVRAIWPWIVGRSTWPFYRPALATTDRALRFLDANAGVPSFAWVHYYDPHLPYVPPAELRAPDAELVSGDWYRLKAREKRELVRDPRRVAAMRGLYDAEIAYVDRELGRLLEAARAAAPPGGLLIAVTADHGEPMGEHGNYWKRDLHDETLHVPLLILPPEREPLATHSVEALVRLIDVAPTLLDWSGAPPLAQAEGLSLRPLAQGAAVPSLRPPAVAVALPESDAFGGLAASVRTELWKLIHKQGDLWAAGSFSPASTSLYYLPSDPGELTDVRASFPDVAAFLEMLLPQLDESRGNPELTTEERESLRALGYLQ